MIIAIPARMSGLSSRSPCSRAGPVTTARCGSQRMIRAPIRSSLSTKNSRFSNIFSKMQDRPARLRRDGERDRGQVGREGRPRPVLDLRDLVAEVVANHELLARRDPTVRSPSSTSMPRRSNAWKIATKSFGSMSSIGHVAAGHRGEPDEAGGLDVLGPDPMLAPGEALDAVDPQHVRADPVDPRAERDEEAAEILDVRLAGGVHEDGLSLGEDGRHDGVLGAHHARLVEEDPLAVQPVGTQLEPAVDLDVRRRAARTRGRGCRAGAGRSCRRRAGRARPVPKRASSGPPRRNEARMRSESSSSTSVFATTGRLDADLVLARSTRRRRRGRRAARSSCRRRGSAGRSRARPARR